MEVVYFSNEFPKDDLSDIFRLLHDRSKTTNHEVLARFNRDATRAVKKEIEKLPSNLKTQIPPFESLSSWVEQKELREGELCGAIDGVLLILLQLSVFIW
jgi:monodictyphenone polyketide synthase